MSKSETQPQSVQQKLAQLGDDELTALAGAVAQAMAARSLVHKPRPRRGIERNHDRDRAVMQMRYAGYSQREIAERFGVSDRMIRTIIKRNEMEGT